jgi:hypothetical protein
MWVNDARLAHRIVRFIRTERGSRLKACPGCDTAVLPGEWCILGGMFIYHPACFVDWMHRSEKWPRI